MLNNNFIFIVIVITGLILGNFYYSTFTSETYVTPALNGHIDDLSGFASISLDVSDLQKNQINSLRIFGEYPVKPGLTGKRNIFAPI